MSFYYISSITTLRHISNIEFNFIEYIIVDSIIRLISKTLFLVYDISILFLRSIKILPMIEVATLTANHCTYS